MNYHNSNGRKFHSLLILVFILLLSLPEFADAGGSFGGRRSSGSFSRSTRSMGLPRSSSFGNRRSQTSPFHNHGSSFGSTRLKTSRAYTSKYGVPRRTIEGKNINGVPKNYRLNDYGGYGSGLMMGYTMGHTPFIWHTPFHRAFYYTQPYYVKNPDGTVSVYPPTFSISKVIFTLFVLAGIIFVLYRIIKSFKYKRNHYSPPRIHYDSKSSFT